MSLGDFLQQRIEDENKEGKMDKRNIMKEKRERV